MSDAMPCEARDVYIVDGSRTPFLKARSKMGAFAAADLAVSTAKQLLMRQPFDPADLDEVITGCMIPSPDEANISRVIALRLGCTQKVPAWTVQRNCASGLQALDNAYQNIRDGRSDLVLAGGTDAMSHAPLLYNRGMANWLGQWFASKTMGQKFAMAAKFRPQFFVPIISLLRGLTDPVVGLSMGQTAENLAFQFDINRRKMDEFAVESHRRVSQGYIDGHFDEVTPLYDHKGNAYTQDDGMRADSSVEKLAKLRPFFDKKYGAVTAGNSSQITDGSAYLVLASAEAVKKFGLKVRAKITDCNWAALDPAVMGLGPVHASTPMLMRNDLKMKDIDYWEINEAFAAQVLACLAAWDDADFCKEHFGTSKAIGSMPLDRLNVDGGAIALGHPVGSSGARIVLHLLHVLERNKAKRGVATLCIGGGQGGAMLIERTTKVTK